MGLITRNNDAFNERMRYICNEGSTRSGKTFSILSVLYWLANNNKVVISVVSETFPHLRKGAIRDFQNIVQGWGLWKEDNWSKSESTYTFENKSIIEFFSVDSPGKVHGPARDILFINEAQNISYDIARHLFVRTTGTIFIDFNPTHEFWTHTELKSDERCKWIHSTYRDNGYLSDEQIREIERNKHNAIWWKVYGEGQIGTVEGLVFNEWTQVDEIPAGLPCRIGLDWGFTNDPTAIVLLYFAGDDIYIDEACYKTQMLNSEIISHVKTLPAVKIIADSAEPKSIEELYRAGLNIHACKKGPDSIRNGINLLLSKRLHITKRSTNIINEFRNYTWDTDKTGKRLQTPIDGYNHSIDSIRYAAMDYYQTPQFYSFSQ